MYDKGFFNGFCGLGVRFYAVSELGRVFLGILPLSSGFFIVGR